MGKALTHTLVREGVKVLLLVRRPAQQPPLAGVNEIEWHPERTQCVLDPSVIEGCDGAVHLAGANLADHRWTPSYKRLILSSRVDTSRALGRIFAALAAPPPVLVAASGIGYYGERGNDVVTEASAPGNGFLPETCQSWEAATAPLAPRVVQLRFGVVLTARGGALPSMQRLFRLGLGGKLGNGREWMSWVSLDDVIEAIHFALETPQLAGACNTTSPYPVTNAEFTHTLARLLHRPALLTVPAFALRAALGQMAQDALLTSTRAVPERLRAAGFLFSHERLEQALGEMI